MKPSKTLCKTGKPLQKTSTNHSTSRQSSSLLGARGASPVSRTSTATASQWAGGLLQLLAALDRGFVACVFFKVIYLLSIQKKAELKRFTLKLSFTKEGVFSVVFQCDLTSCLWVMDKSKTHITVFLNKFPDLLRRESWLVCVCFSRGTCHVAVARYSLPGYFRFGLFHLDASTYVLDVLSHPNSYWEGTKAPNDYTSLRSFKPLHCPQPEG